MITFLSSPKPFVGISLSNQMNAIRSWLALGDAVEVILYGNSDGTKRIVSKFGIQWVPDIETNEFGTPLFGAIANHAARHGKYDLQIYVNCDILFTKEIMFATKNIPFKNFLIIGRRIDLASGTSVDPTNEDWLIEIEELAEKHQVSFSKPGAIDYFIFRRNLWKKLPSISIGRGGYDGVLVAYCLRKKIPVCDATLCIPVIHQYHDYEHLKQGRDEVLKGVEAQRNREACFGSGEWKQSDATWIMKKDGLEKKKFWEDPLRRIEVYTRLFLKCNFLARALLFLRYKVYREALYDRKRMTLNEVLDSYRELGKQFKRNKSVE